VVAFLHQYDTGEVPSVIHEVVDDPEDIQPRAAKRRKYTSRVVSVGRGEFLKQLGLENCATSDRGVYPSFCEELVTQGCIMWRKHSDYEDTIVMNDYSLQTGKVLLCSFCHVASFVRDGKLLVECSCPMYRQIHSVGLSSVGNEDTVILDESFTCMHCRFYREKLHPLKQQILTHNSSSNLGVLVQENLSHLNDPVVLVGEASTHVTTKLSVVGEQDCFLVHLNFTSAGNCFARCQKGFCQTYHMNRKRVPKKVSPGQEVSEDLCPHIKTLFSNLEILSTFFPSVFSVADGAVGDDVEDAEPVFPEGEVPPDEVPDCTGAKVTFNQTTGLWESNSLSVHPPWPDSHPELIKHTFIRLGFLRDGPGPQGLYKGPEFYPSTVDDDGTPSKCQHGVPFTSPEHPAGLQPIHQHQTMLFTHWVC